MFVDDSANNSWFTMRDNYPDIYNMEIAGESLAELECRLWSDRWSSMSVFEGGRLDSR